MHRFCRKPPNLAVSLAGLVLLVPSLAHAHSFGRLYNLPVPFWLYAYGAAAALLLSFLLVAWFASAAPAVALSQAPNRDRALRNPAWCHALRVLQIMSLGGLLLCLLTGFVGNRNPYSNFSMTAFWIVFVLGFSYFTAVAGDLYRFINPWQMLAQSLDLASNGFSKGRLRYPARLAYWPALALYMLFIWIELFGHMKPFSLAVVLLGYSIINLVGVWLIGKTAWFRYCEFFAVCLRLIGKMAPFAYEPAQRPGESARLRLRAPFVGLLEERAEHLSLVVFILFMLSSTAFDGLRATRPWYTLFWLDPFNLVSPWVGTQPVYAYTTLRSFYLAYETLCLLLSPFLYLGIYLVLIAAAKALTRSSLSVKQLALAFAFSLLPIALVYNITHYYTLILTQGVTILSLLSDPFGWGWNLFGTAGKFRAPILPEMGLIWHSQVGLIVFGHIASVYLAHREALALFPNRWVALLSQLPMLLLMMIFTTAGLWILAQPIQGS